MKVEEHKKFTIEFTRKEFELFEQGLSWYMDMIYEQVEEEDYEDDLVTKTDKLFSDLYEKIANLS